MPKPQVLLDTNVILSGLVYATGNEHKILKLAEEKRILLILPEFILEETRNVLAKRFPGHQELFETFLRRTAFTTIPRDEIEPLIEPNIGRVRDRNDTPVLAAIVHSKPDYAVTGDKVLRADLQRLKDVTDAVRILSPRQFLELHAFRPK